MKAKTLIGIATGMVLAGLGYFGVKQARLARAVEAELHRARSESTSLLRRATARLARAKADQVARQAELAMVSGPTMPGPAGATPVGVAPSHSIDQMLKEADERLNDPVMQNLQLAARRVDLATWYAPFFRLRGMSPSQVEVFLDLELKDNAGTEDLVAAMRAHGLSLNDPGIQKLGEEIGMGHLPAQRALLGEEGFRQWQEYQGTLRKRIVVSQWAGEATMAGITVAPQQAERLIQAIANANRSPGSANRSTDWNRVEDEARAIFSPAQLEFFAARMRLEVLGEKMGKLQHDAEEAEEAKTPEATIAPTAKAPGG